MLKRNPEHWIFYNNQFWRGGSGLSNTCWTWFRRRSFEKKWGSINFKKVVFSLLFCHICVRVIFVIFNRFEYVPLLRLFLSGGCSDFAHVWTQPKFIYSLNRVEFSSWYEPAFGSYRVNIQTLDGGHMIRWV